MSSAKRIIIFGLVLFVDARIRRGQSWVNKKKRPIKAAIFYLIVHYSFKTVFKTKYSFGILIFFLKQGLLAVLYTAPVCFEQSLYPCTGQVM